MIAPAFSYRIITVPEYPIYGQRRTHRKKRINKKWRKRYGMKVVGYSRICGDNLIVDERNQLAYCHADIANALRREMERLEQSTKCQADDYRVCQTFTNEFPSTKRFGNFDFTSPFGNYDFTSPKWFGR